EIIEVVSQPAESVPESGYFLNRVFVFCGRQIRHCGYFPSWNLRLFKRGKARYEQRLVHEHMIVEGKTAYLKHLLIHEDRRGLEHFFAKHNRYSTLEAREIYESPEPWPGLRRFFTDRVTRRRFGKSRVLPYLPIPWLWRFFYMYFVRFGFLDGRAGWYLCHFIAAYEYSIQLKFTELRRLGGARNLKLGGLSDPEGSAVYSEEILFPPARQRRQNGQARVAGSRVGGSTGRSIATPDAIPTLFEGKDQVSRFESPWTFRQNLGRALWMVTEKILFRLSFHNWYGWRRMLLRLFGAKIGKQVRVRPSARIEIPWNIEIGDSSVIGDHAILYSLGKITIGRRVGVSQYAHLCAGTHDFNDPTFPLVKPPIRVEDEVWIAADAFVGPGVTVHRGAVVGARSSAFKDIPEGAIAVGNPAKELRKRDGYSACDAVHPGAAEPAGSVDKPLETEITEG
ncbi:MAG TPA: WcaF family extracellular polysaccharide biosynthesis acetyltransferase, partial [Tepidisphaeraceae bacterium]|nr:WcaF family extracellular polysaccharide biosynthesis acetyltransferase [Tepidisphaeraceae bacterium]